MRNEIDDERFENETLIKEYDTSLKNAFELAEFWEFECLRDSFDHNMRMILQIIPQWPQGFRQDSFMKSFTLSKNVTNQQAVKEKIFDTLLRFEFIIQKGEHFIGTEKIHRFLRHVGIES